MTVSAPVKIFALVGVLAAVVLGGGMMFMGGGVEAEPAAIVLPKKAAALAAVPAKPAAKPAVKKVAAKPAVKKVAAKPAPAKPKPARPAKTPVIAANGLPSRLVSALRRENVVVLALWGSGGKIDRLALDEAAAGAAAAGVGFVQLNVLESNREAEALTLKLGVVLRAPTVLFFTGSGDLAVRLDGFRDRETVAQAALDALR
jgi:hypothetical protein